MERKPPEHPVTNPPVGTCPECGHDDPHDVPPIQLCRSCPCDGPSSDETRAFFERLRAAVAAGEAEDLVASLPDDPAQTGERDV